MTPSLKPAAPAAHKDLRCPKCGNEMATYERSGIVVEQCRECRGIFLDQGELERLVDAEGGAWLGPAPRFTAPRTEAGEPIAAGTPGIS
jgi:uncharacterized protein